MKTNECPHCGASANPLTLSLYTTTCDYKCKSCEKKSRMNRKSMGAIGGIGIIVAVLAKSTFQIEGTGLIVFAITGSIAVAATMFFGLKLKPIKE